MHFAGTGLDYISFLWGSPDLYNTLTIKSTGNPDAEQDQPDQSTHRHGHHRLHLELGEPDRQLVVARGAAMSSQRSCSAPRRPPCGAAPAPGRTPRRQPGVVHDSAASTDPLLLDERLARPADTRAHLPGLSWHRPASHHGQGVPPLGAEASGADGSTLRCSLVRHRGDGRRMDRWTAASIGARCPAHEVVESLERDVVPH